MTHTSRIVAIIAITALVIWIAISPRFLREKFANVVAANDIITYSNKGPEPWNHHPISSSIPIDIVTKSNKPYYYEFDNAQFDVAISKTFEYPCKLAPELLNKNAWSIVDLTEDSPARSGALVAHQKALEFVKARMNASEHMQLPYDNPQKRPQIQIVHDVLTQVRLNVGKSSKYILNMELVIYREAKYNGKHVSMTIMTDYSSMTKSWTFDVLEINVLGVVYEDNIGLFPVVASYDEQTSGADFDTLLNDKVIPSDDVVDTIVKQQQSASAKNVATTNAIKPA